jgi:transcriptional regulator with XRE-family HTH domain
VVVAVVDKMFTRRYDPSVTEKGDPLRQREAAQRALQDSERRLRAADRRIAATRRTFSENIDRLLGLHQLTSDWAAQLLGVSVTTLSYWRNGHREPDNVAVLKRLGDFFGIEPYALLTTPFTELLPKVADPVRFESVERRIVEGMYGDAGLPEKGVSDPAEDLEKLAKDHLAARRARKATK